MEFASYSTHNNITGIACKFAKKAFKFRSLGVFFSHTNQQKVQSHGSCSNEVFTEKVHPQPQDLEGNHKSNTSFDIEDVFDSISILKLAYVNLQNAQLPYDPLKISAADECIVLQLEKLSKMKHSFERLMRIKKAASDSCNVAVHANLQLLDELESEIKAKESSIVCLKKEVQDLSIGNAKMIERLASSNKEGRINATFFEETYGVVSYAIRDFTKLLIKLMRDSNWDLDSAADSIEKSVISSKKSHKKYAFQAFVARRMFHSFSSQSHGNGNFDHKLRFEDPISALIEDPTSPFAEFCISKYLLLIHPKLEASFFGSLDHRAMISRGKHPRTEFYQAFVKMAKWVWLLREIAGLLKPKLQLFGVQRGTKFCGVYMESISSELDSCNAVKVEFMVMPGFRIGNAVVKCKVYASMIEH